MEHSLPGPSFVRSCLNSFEYARPGAAALREAGSRLAVCRLSRRGAARRLDAARDEEGMTKEAGPRRGEPAVESSRHACMRANSRITLMRDRHQWRRWCQ